MPIRIICELAFLFTNIGKQGKILPTSFSIPTHHFYFFLRRKKFIPPHKIIFLCPKKSFSLRTANQDSPVTF